MPEQPEWFAERFPDRPAVADDGRVMTYAELNRRANRLADALSGLSLARGVVAVRLHIRPEWFVVNLALAKLGWEQVAVSWRLTPAECRGIVLDCAAALLVADDEDPAGLAAAVGVPVVTVGAASRAGAPSLDDLAARGGSAERFSEEPARLVTYSSGTTAAPRGVRKPRPTDPESRRRLDEYLGQRERQQARSADGDRVLLALPLHHGAGPNTAVSALGRGATVHLLDRFDPVRALTVIDRHRITRWTAVPTMLSRIRALPPEVSGAFDVGSIRWLGIGSAPVPMSLKKWAIDFFGPHCLVESYGASEVGMVAVMPPSLHLVKPGSCGRLRRGVEVRVLGPDGEPVPPHQEGELYIKTPLTISAYVNQAPFGTEALTADGFFRVGDIGRLDEDGFLFITGRAKETIISGGVNIHPGEIEGHLVEHPDVIDAAVVGVDDDDLGERVVAFCEVRAGSEVMEADIRGRLAGSLAKFKHPHRIIFVDELPRNAMGKTRKADLRRLATVARAGE